MSGVLSQTRGDEPAPAPSLPGQDLAGAAARMSRRIEELRALSEPGAGVTRLAYTPGERRAHELFAGWMRELGLRTWTDAAGNTIAERPGTRCGWPALGTGSHLDSVPHGGAFDGIAGVVAAAEVARHLVQAEVEHQHPLRFVAFAAEEGARFGQACLGSRLAAGLSSAAELRARRDAQGISIAEAMRSVGLDPDRAVDAPWNPAEWAAFLELHVEQGAVLQDADTSVGVVDLVSGSTRLLLEVDGRASHTGATPMAGRRDALTAAAEVVLLAEGLATDARHHGTRVTVGRLEVSPGSTTTIPGRVTMTVDVRDVDSDRQRSTAAELLRGARAVCDRRGTRLSATLIGDTSPVVLPAWLRSLVTDEARAQAVTYRVMTSGASHDSQMVNHVVPAAILFVPSRDGLSHVPEEWTDPRELAVGVDVLCGALLLADSRLADDRTSR